MPFISTEQNSNIIWNNKSEKEKPMKKLTLMNASKIFLLAVANRKRGQEVKAHQNVFYGLMFLVALALALPGSSLAQTVYAHIPFGHTPYGHIPYSGNKCKPGHTYTKFQGKEMCIACKPGYSYGIHQGQEKCIK